MHSVLHQLGEQLVTAWVGLTQGNDDAGRKLLRQTLAEKDCVLVIDNVESLFGSRTRESSDNGDATESSDRILTNSATTDVLTSLFTLLTSLSVGRTRIVFTSRSPLPAPFSNHHIRIDRLSRAEAVELVSHVLQREGVRPRAEKDAETDIDKLVDAVNRHARSLVLLAAELKRTNVSAATVDLTELMHRLHARFPNDREHSLFASLELALLRLSPEVRRLVPKLAVFHGGCNLSTLAMVLSFNRNTVQLFITTVWAKVFVNGLSFLCSGRHFFQRDIFRLITRGLIRLHRAGIFSQLISQSTASNQPRKLVSV